MTTEQLTWQNDALNGWYSICESEDLECKSKNKMIDINLTYENIITRSDGSTYRYVISYKRDREANNGYLMWVDYEIYGESCDMCSNLRYKTTVNNYLEILEQHFHDIRKMAKDVYLGIVYINIFDDNNTIRLINKSKSYAKIQKIFEHKILFESDEN